VCMKLKVTVKREAGELMGKWVKENMNITER
jgi:hypothetical protein